MINIHNLSNEALCLLKNLIRTPSLSRNESNTADIIENYLVEKGLNPKRKGNNIWCTDVIDNTFPTILLTSHHDTVKPSSSWTKDPFTPIEENGKLFGLGSNDAGAPLVSLLMTYSYLITDRNRKYNLIFAAVAEEEVTGMNGLPLILDDIGRFDLAIVGEPTKMQMAIAERGLIVLDCSTKGKTGHAARQEGDNAIYKALPDIEWFRTFVFPKQSELLGPVKMTVSMIEAGYTHNIVPDICKYVVDIRVNELYSNFEILDIIRQNMKWSQIEPRSTRHKSSFIDKSHPIVTKGLSLGLTYFGSPTCSDQMRIEYNSIKIGPGDSARSHSADEYIYLSELEEGILTYIDLLKDFTF